MFDQTETDVEALREEVRGQLALKSQEMWDGFREAVQAGVAAGVTEAEMRACIVRKVHEAYDAAPSPTDGRRAARDVDRLDGNGLRALARDIERERGELAGLRLRLKTADLGATRPCC